MVPTSSVPRAAGVIDLNADLGEIPGETGAAIDAALLAVVTSANVATGGHAGDAASMSRVCRAAVAAGVSIGAHVSYPDRENFGRADIDMAPGDLIDTISEQLLTLQRIAEAHGTDVDYVKPHGALYNRAARDRDTAQVLAAALEPFGLPILTLPDSRLAEAATRVRLVAYSEGFIDRGYTSRAALVPRDRPDALITDPQRIRRRAVALARGHPFAAVDGGEVRVSAHSLCLHADTPGSAQLAAAVRQELLGENLRLAPFTAGATHPPPMREVGADALLLPVRNPSRRQRLSAVDPSGVHGVTELVPGSESVLVRFDRTLTDAVSAAAAVVAAAQSSRTQQPRVHELPVLYHGPDLADVAAAVGQSVADVVRRHSTAEYECQFCGFSPGFAYLTGGDPSLHLPRRSNPRTRVPAGSVAIAERFSAVYPTASPGGWHLLGSTPVTLFDPAARQPALIRPGDRVRFAPVVA